MQSAGGGHLVRIVLRHEHIVIVFSLARIREPRWHHGLAALVELTEALHALCLIMREPATQQFTRAMVEVQQPRIVCPAQIQYYLHAGGTGAG
jgi:hypothetical protein